GSGRTRQHLRGYSTGAPAPVSGFTSANRSGQCHGWKRKSCTSGWSCCLRRIVCAHATAGARPAALTVHAGSLADIFDIFIVVSSNAVLVPVVAGNAPAGRLPPSAGRSLAGTPVDTLTQQVGMTGVPGILLDHVDKHVSRGHGATTV